MTNARGKEIDNTHLSVDQAEERGFLHRDYIAHCLRWTHVAKYLNLKSRYKKAAIIDIGCGKDMPLAKMLYTMRMAPENYVGIEYNKCKLPSMFDNAKFKPFLISGADFCVVKPWVSTLFNYSVCFEVLEHVEPMKAIEILHHLPVFLRPESVSWFSTPCWDKKVGAANNHVNEMTYEAFGSLLEEMGYKILNHWGTFASLKDYKHKLLHNLDWNILFTKLSGYYDTNYLSTIFAPMFPEYSRNCLWETQYVGKLKLEERQFTQITQLEGRLGSSAKWRDITKCVDYVKDHLKT